MFCVCNAKAQIHFTLPLPSRGHGVEYNQANRHILVFARRPGQYIKVVDTHDWRELKHLTPSKNRYFYGHGTYSEDSCYLYVTEGEQGTSRGFIGIYEVQKGYQKVGELSAYGIGPHQITLYDAKHIAVCIGGLSTQGRTVLNQATMQPALNIISLKGELVETSILPDSKLSIRHLSGNAKDGLYVALQEKRQESREGALLAEYRFNEGLILFDPGAQYWARFNGYIGSVAQTKDLVIATSPRGHRFGVWDKKSHELIAMIPLSEVCGLAATQDEFFVSSGLGEIQNHTAKVVEKAHSRQLQWDNHMIFIDNF
ncbi:DUF1513 domain-containing protein [Vibrio agarivorans]|uniref:DUF1513 domain-containing protein n=1 Tax=Vibrio agarivorans TaxID=153622 RepID=A0ABT7Y0A7_9VIBR|nr:DUF1513 domain-containing protein [Vibrio agarivorans]